MAITGRDSNLRARLRHRPEADNETGGALQHGLFVIGSGRLGYW
jgi:hypothetical protein